MMTVNEFWARLAINGGMTLIGLVMLLAGSVFGILPVVIGPIGIAWTVIAAKRQTERMNRAIVDKLVRDRE